MPVPDEAKKAMQQGIWMESLNSSDETWITHIEAGILAEAAARGLDAAGFKVVAIEDLDN